MKNLLMVIALILPAQSWAEGDVFVTDKHGCKLLDTGDSEPLAYDWKGKCKAGYAEGRGLLLANRQNKPFLKETVTFHNGMREGHSSISYLNGGRMVRSEVEYVHGLRNGPAVDYLDSGDSLEHNYRDGVSTKHLIYSGKDGSRFEGDELSEANFSGKRRYANGDEYEGTLTHGVRNGVGKFTRKGEPPQVGEFILDEFVDVKEEAIKDLMPAKFGLEFGMTTKQVAALTGGMTESATSSFRNAYEVTHFPDEKITIPNMTIGKRTVYFDEDGKLWRVWAEILLKENTYFGGGEVMQAYGTLKRWLSLTREPFKSVQTYPHMQQDISNCRDVADWEKDNPDSFGMAKQVAPQMAPAQRVIFDIGCGAIPFWYSNFLSRDGKEKYVINIRFGNLYATPLAYSVGVDNEEELGKKMWKTSPK